MKVLYQLVGVVGLAASTAQADFASQKSVEGCRVDRSNDSDRLIALSDTIRCWMTEAEVRILHQNNTGFVDDTDGLWTEGVRLGRERRALHLDAKTYPTIPAFPEVVKAVNAKVNPNDLKTLLTTYVNKFTTRHKTSSQGLASSIWFTTTDDGWGQVSVIFRIDPVKPAVNNDLLILGAHQDSINQRDGKAAPGADDDGSGTVTIFTALKYLLSSPQWVPTRPIEFHWYSAEEYDSVKKTGLEGSKQIATAYAKAKVDVYAMLQNDMTGWTRGGTKVISLTDDFTSLPLNQFLEVCITTYLTTKVSRNTCGYGCSDHASWFNAGYAVAYPFEEDGPVNPNVHSSKDTIATLDFDHMAEFTRLAVAFVVELSQAKTKLP
ncbi:hypothetical protein H257_13144 [Aphanomyces astaci]|uniref:Peptidase M28 domain-containing protein n=1 Tax=Aphanomyces astaci TaxID=112090 RepID=W4FW12_APHAT|nr:hypothetical protein H257_13144 [Aphanomyces astaci]ETV71715.1 hypothetical protein H257_13144 [Aphanomyces astaci]|eukprot:XP_009838903.1 hypothetical protein H257_13144 [Aphanomyces astaci]